MRAGSICDPDDAPGATFLLSRTIDRGTATRSAEQIAEELDNHGITLTITVTRHIFSMVCTCLAEDFDAVFALLGDIIMSPTLPESELATRRGEVITSIRQDDDNPAVRATEALMALLYENHPYGRRLKGTVADVEALTRARLAHLHARRFAPSELIAVVVGDVEASHAADAAQRIFGDWRTPPPPPIQVAHAQPADARRRLVIPMMNKSQADIARIRGDCAPRSRVSRVLADEQRAGAYAIGGRLGDSIRERQGWRITCRARSTRTSSRSAGDSRGCRSANVDRAVASIDERSG